MKRVYAWMLAAIISSAVTLTCCNTDNPSNKDDNPSQDW